ncbi:MAG: tetratricopeptide repeat protein, partial [Bryobacteraceae bacterium]|nr:tetratricopeptide repeat protein [Bryobacteraceae bacterium]
MRAFFAFLLLTAPLTAAEDPRIAKGFDHFYNLEYDEAIAEFSKALADDPKDANRHNHLAQA